MVRKLLSISCRFSMNTRCSIYPKQCCNGLPMWYKAYNLVWRVFFIFWTLKALLRDKVTKFNDSLRFFTANENPAMFRTSLVQANMWFRHGHAAHMRRSFDTWFKINKPIYHSAHATAHSCLKMLHTPSLKLSSLLLPQSSTYHPIFIN